MVPNVCGKIRAKKDSNRTPKFTHSIASSRCIGLSFTFYIALPCEHKVRGDAINSSTCELFPIVLLSYQLFRIDLSTHFPILLIHVLPLQNYVMMLSIPSLPSCRVCPKSTFGLSAKLLHGVVWRTAAAMLNRPTASLSMALPMAIVTVISKVSKFLRMRTANRRTMIAS